MAKVIGLDFGSDSVRAVIVNTDSGELLSQAVCYYPRWRKGQYCEPSKNIFRQHPLDYIESMETVIKEALKQCPSSVAEEIIGIGVDTTGSTPVLANSDGVPLGLLNEFENDPDALFILWKDHSSVDEAAEINKMARKWDGIDPTAYVGGIYSSEWFWAKTLHIIRQNDKVAKAASTIIEHCDWIPALLTGVKDMREIKRSRCAAGHKALWNENFDGYPSEDFFAQLDERLIPLVRSLGTETYTSDKSAGSISLEWAQRLGVPETCHIAVGAFDAHMGAVGADVRSYQLAKVMGTSTCDILVAPPQDIKKDEILVEGICGQVDGSVLPGLVGYEAGQSAFGDVYAWFKKLLLWPLTLLEQNDDFTESEKIKTYLEDNIIPSLEKEANQINPKESGVIALDWLNGRRTPDADQRLKGAITGLSLGTDAPRIYRALVESTAFGSKAIVDRFRSQGIPINSVIALGGVSQKAELVMQIVADILDMDISVSAADQACALGAAMFASVAAGKFTNLDDAQNKMSAGFSKVYKPDPKMVEVYKEIYKQYQLVGNCEEQLVELRKEA